MINYVGGIFLLRNSRMNCTNLNTGFNFKTFWPFPNVPGSHWDLLIKFKPLNFTIRSLLLLTWGIWIIFENLENYCLFMTLSLIIFCVLVERRKAHYEVDVFWWRKRQDRTLQNDVCCRWHQLWVWTCALG